MTNYGYVFEDRSGGRRSGTYWGAGAAPGTVYITTRDGERNRLVTVRRRLTAEGRGKSGATEWIEA